MTEPLPPLDDRAAVREVGWIAAEARALIAAPLDDRTTLAGRARWLDYYARKIRLLDYLAEHGQADAAELAAESRANRARIAANPAPGCACVEVGPLLVAPGTSGRTWRCGGCGAAWSPPSA